MKKLTSNGENLDRLSELPDSLILEILSLLEMRDVVKTTLLSKRWKYLWTTITCLNFAECGSNAVQVRNFVSRTLTLWRGTRLRKFNIFITSVEDAALLYSSDLDLWVLFAMERKVEEFHICLFPRGCSLYCPPQCLYECSSLRKLTLLGCDLRILGNVQWDRVTWLTLDWCCFPEGVIDKVLSSSPQLESLELSYFHEVQNLSIRSSSLKKLRVGSYVRQSSELTIWAPNLETLTLSDKQHVKFLLTNFSSLTELYLGFSGNSSALTEEALCQILSASQHAVTVRLSADCLKVLGDRKGKYSFPPLLNVKLLRIENDLTELRELVGVLEIFPKLKMLIVNWSFKHSRELLSFNAENYTMSVANILKSNLLELRTAKFTWNSYKSSIFEFIEFLLKHATMIEKILVIRGIQLEADKTDSMLLAAQKMLSLQRSFPNVEMVIC